MEAETSDVRRLLIVWWSRTGASEQLARAAEAAARAAVTELEDAGLAARVVACRRCDEVGPAELLAAQAYLFVAPENLGSLAGVMKDLFDRCYYPVLDRLEGRAYASIVAAGSDGQGATRQIARIVTGWRLRCVAEPLIINLGAQTPEQILAPKHLDEPQLAGARQLGATLAGGLVAGIW